MPIKLLSKSYTDIYGNATDSYKANAGDKIVTTINISSDIYVRSSSLNTMSFDAIDGTLTQSNGDFIESGFRVGQTLTWKYVNTSNVVTSTFTPTIVSVSATRMELSGSYPSLNLTSSQEYIWFIYCDDVHDEIELGVNYVRNDNPQAKLGSLLDGEVSRFIYKGLDAMIVTDVESLTQIGKKSGQFDITDVTIERLADSTDVYITGRDVRNYEISFTTIFNGILFPDLFIGTKCLNQYTQLAFKVIQGEGIEPTILELNDKSDTGFFEEAYNSEIPDVQSFDGLQSNLYYNQDNVITFDIEVEGTSLSQLEFGGCYVTKDDTYNYNVAGSQSTLLHLLKTDLVDATDIATEYTSSGAYPFKVVLDSFSYVDATNRTFSVGITLKPQYSTDLFGKFIEDRGDSDRLFYLWVKAGNTNKLIYGGQLEYAYAVGQEISTDLYVITNHYYNSDYSDLTTPVNCTDFNPQDDVAYIANVPLSKNDDNQSVNVSVVVRNSVTEEEIKLDQVTFDLTDQDLDYFVTQTATISNNLPQSSAKKIAYLMQNTYVDPDLVARVYFPFSIDWKYWNDLVITSPEFLASGVSNNDWEGLQTGNWGLNVKLEVNRNDTTDYLYRPFIVYDYDVNPVTSTIALYTYPDLTASTNIKEGQQMLIEASHFNTLGNWGSDVYGQIVIENYEGTPEWRMSTIIDTNTDATNPLYGITDDKLTTSGLSTDTIVFTCLLDTTKLTGGNFTIYSKISDEKEAGGDGFVFTTDAEVFNTNNVNFITE